MEKKTVTPRSAVNRPVYELLVQTRVFLRVNRPSESYQGVYSITG